MIAFIAPLLLALGAGAADLPPHNAAEPQKPGPQSSDTDTTLYQDTKGGQPEVKEKSLHPHGWFTGGSSLLFYDEKGDLAVELPLVQDEEQSGARLQDHSITGGAAPNSRFGWTFEKTTTWNQDRTKVYNSRRLLRIFGSEGRELWSTSEADRPETGDPVIFSSDAETLLVSLHTDKGWTAQVKGWAGNTIIEVGPVPRLQFMALTRNGKYATVRWVVPDQSATHTFVEVPTKTRQDVPSDELYLGLAKINEDGKVYSGKRFVFDFAAAPKKGVPPGLPAAAAPPAASTGAAVSPLAPPAQDLDRR